MNDGSAADVARVILVANDDGNEAPISLSTEIAEAFQAELYGLFIRDQRLRDLVSSPFAQTFVPGGGAKRPLTQKAIESAWARNEARFRRLVMDRASRRKVSCSFRRVEGAFDACLLEGVDRRDLVAIALEPSSAKTGSQLDTVLSLAKRAQGVLLMSRTIRRGDAQRRAPIVVLDAGIERGRQTFDLASGLARATGRSLIALSSNEASSTTSTDDGVPSERSVTALFVAGRSAQDLTDVARRLAPALIIADVRQQVTFGGMIDGDLLNALIRNLSAPILLLAND